MINLAVTDKQTAEQLLAKLIREREREVVGLAPSKSLIEAMKKSVADHATNYSADLYALGRDDEHVDHVYGRIRCLAAECGWATLGDISSDSFQTWRQRQTYSRKTLNEYLSAARAFCNWLVKHGRLNRNPLQSVERADVRGHQVERRALATDEAAELLARSGSRSIFYLAAVHTGLRRGELEGLRWADLNLNVSPSTITVRASTSKNRRLTVLPLHNELRAALLSIRTVECSPDALVFASGLPRMRVMRADFDAAGISAVDAQGRKADFHSLRKTFNMNLQANGAGFTTTMNLMRHSDPRLTAQTYTDAALLPLSEAVARLPWFGKSAAAKGTEKGTGPIVKTGSDLSSGVLGANDAHLTKDPAKIGRSSDLSSSVLFCQTQQLVEAGGVEPPSA